MVNENYFFGKIIFILLNREFTKSVKNGAKI